MTLERSTVARLRSSLEQYHAAVAKGSATPLELEVMESRLGKMWITNGYAILRISEA